MNTNGFNIDDYKRAATPPSVADWMRNAELFEIATYLQKESYNLRLDSTPNVRNLKSIDCDKLADMFDALAERIERYVATAPAMDRAMPGIPMVRVLDPETGKEIVRGWYVAYPETTYCVKEDYERNPPRLIEGVVCWEMTDWGLPNRMGFRQVTAPHKIEIIPPEEMREVR